MYPLRLTRGWCRLAVRGVGLWGDFGVRGRGVIIGVIFGNLTDEVHLQQNASIEYIFDSARAGTHPSRTTEVAGLAGSWATATSST